jgi:hypothetical protein
MNKTLARAGAVVTAARPDVHRGNARVGQRDRCKGDVYAFCVAVNGSKLHVSSIKSRVALYAKACWAGHSPGADQRQALRRRHAGKDKEYCPKSTFGAEVTTGIWSVNRNYAKGTKICSRVWRYTGATGPGTSNGYSSYGTACATVG